MCKTAIPKLFQIILNFKESVKINRNLGYGRWTMDIGLDIDQW